LAAGHGQLEDCELIIGNVDDKHPIDANGDTPVSIAERQGHAVRVAQFNDS